MGLADSKYFDIFIIGGGINGASIARDAAGRGLKTGLAERGDFASATSSASTKLLHGGLRYLEFGEFGLVRKALNERSIIFDAAPNLSGPLPFIIPRMRHTRPDWQIKTALFLYDHLGDRGGMPKSQKIELRRDRAGRGIDPGIFTGWRYYDGWIDDSRMTISLLRDAENKGATIFPRQAVVKADYADGLWSLELSNGQIIQTYKLINATGPWAEETARNLLALNDAPHLRLVQGSHIIVKRRTSAEDALMVQQPDKRIIFLVPIASDYLMIGTTEQELQAPPLVPVASPDEIVYLIKAANSIVTHPISVSDIVHTTVGIRPLVVDGGKSARETSRDWKLHRHSNRSAMTVIGGKITTHRILAEAVLKVMAPETKQWTKGHALPDCDFEPQNKEHNRDAYERWSSNMTKRFPDYRPSIVKCLASRFGRASEAMLSEGLGQEIGGLFEAELKHFVEKEWAVTAQDILWRRTKLGLSASEDDIKLIEQWLMTNRQQSSK